MGKAASKKNIERAHAAHDADPGALGPWLGVLVYRCNVPAAAVATLLRISLPTLYRWIYGANDVADPFRKRVTRFCLILQDALAAEVLPAHGGLQERVQILADVVRATLAKPRA